MFLHFLHLVIARFVDHANIRLILQLISGIFKRSQKLTQYTNDTAILTSLVFPAGQVIPVIFALNLND